MPSLTIPKSAYAAIQHLIHFSASDFEAFLDALSRAEPSLDQDKFWSHVAAHVKHVDQAVVKSIVHEVFEMDDARTEMEINEFAESIAEAAAFAKSEKFPFEEGDRKTLKERLVRIFEGRKGFNITRKAMGVLLNQEHVFIHAQMLTDIRPVFNEKGDSVDAAVIVHNLRIHFGEDSEHKDFYVALDTSDIQSLRDVLDRADAKAKCLQGLLKTSGVSYLNAAE
jgi:hypothetical protein